jgi:lipopolysaccharide transport system permease protein
LAVGIWTAALNVRYRDTGTALPVLLQLWMFASPILYPQVLLPEAYRGLYEINPMVGIIQAFRACLHGGDFDFRSLSISIAITLVALALGLFFFKRTEDELSDIV